MRIYCTNGQVCQRSGCTVKHQKCREDAVRRAPELNETLELATILKAVDDEPELPGNMPDEMWNAISGDRDAMTEALRVVVRKTKEGIKKRIAALR